MTLAMYHVDCARIRMPMACAAIAAIVLAAAALLALASWISEADAAGRAFAPHAGRALEAEGRPGRRF